MQNPTVRTVLAILLAFFVLFAQSVVVMVVQFTAGSMPATPWLLPALGHSTMLALSFLLILVLGRGKPSTFGFRRPDSFPLVTIVLWSVGLGAVSAALESLAPGKGMEFVESYSFLEVVIFIWVWASVCEEVFVRGLIQGFLAPLKSHGVTVAGTRFSLPVIVGALLFGAMHMALLSMGTSLPKVLVIVCFGTGIGVVAGYYREKTGSLGPAVVAHMLANMVGSAAAFLWG